MLIGFVLAGGRGDDGNWDAMQRVDNG